MSNINKIKVSGQTYSIQDENATKTVELTQAQYDALSVKDPNTFYIITDATGGDLSNYYTKSEADDLLDTKLDVSAYTPTDLSNYYKKSETSGATQISTALASKANKSEIPSLDGYATETWVEGKGYLTEHQDISGKLDVSAFNTYSGSVNTQLNSKASESDLNALNDTVTAHTANTTVHVTASEKSAWNGKSDFSGNYNDLSNKPTIPSKTSDLTNDSDFATTGDVQTATNDMATKTWVGNQGYLTEHQSLSNYYTKSETSGATEISTALASKADTTTTYTKTETDNAITAVTSTKQDTLVSGTNIKTINNESILGSGNITIEGGGGKAINAGRGISVTTGETADTVSFNLPISAMTGTNIMYGGTNNSVSITGGSSNYNNFFGSGNTISVSGISSTSAISNIVLGDINSVNLRGSREAWQYSLIIGQRNSVSHSTYMGGASAYNIICGFNNTIEQSISDCVVIGSFNKPKKAYNTNIGQNLNTNNDLEFAHAKYNVSSSASTTFGNSGNTLFSVGNGSSDSARHNAFEIRQNGDIYIADTNDTSTTNYYQKPMIKLQDALGGTVDTEITSASTNPVTSAAIYNQFGGLKLVKLTQSEYDALSTKDSNTLYVIVN